MTEEERERWSRLGRDARNAFAMANWWNWGQTSAQIRDIEKAFGELAVRLGELVHGVERRVDASEAD